MSLKIFASFFHYLTETLSVLLSDTICDLGGALELANYGEYSGAPSESQTYEYAKTIMKLMTEAHPHPDGKYLFKVN